MRSTIVIVALLTGVIVGCDESASPSPATRDQRFEIADARLAVTFPFDWRVEAPIGEIHFSTETEYEMSLWWDLTAKGPHE